MPPKVISIVEGHGEVHAVPVLIRRLANEVMGPPLAVVAPPSIRIARSKVVKPNELERAVRLAALQAEGKGGIVVILDADDDCPATLGPELLARARAAIHHEPQTPVSVVIAKMEFEAWFLAAALSLRGRRGLTADLMPPDDPENKRDAKGWLSDRMPPNEVYSEVLDQPALAACMDLNAARAANSFDKFYRDMVVVLGTLQQP